MKSMLISAFAICLAAAAPTVLWAADEHKAQGGGHAAPAAQRSAPVRNAAPAGGGMRGGGRSAPTMERSRPTASPMGGGGRSAPTMERSRPAASPMGGMQGGTRERSTTRGGGMTGTSHAESTGTLRNRHTTTGGTTGNTERTRNGTTERTPTGRTERATTTTRSKVDVSSRRKNITASHRYHFGTYNAPQGYSYHRYSYGDRLPEEYFGRDYWILDFADYGLGVPPYGYVWVRYGPDAVLIDEDTGEIVEIVYDQFY